MRASGQVGMTGKPGNMGDDLAAIKEDEDADMLDEQFLDRIDDTESDALHHNYDMINLRLRPEVEEENPFRQ